jgi:hypothetical protein
MSTKDTISGLVAQRSTRANSSEQVAENFSNTVTAHRNIEAIRTEEVFLFGVSVYTATGNLVLDCSDDLEMNPELGKVVKESDGRFTISVPVFPELKKAGTKLSSKRAAIQKKYLRYARPYWYVCKDNMPALRDDLLKEDPTGEDDGLFPMCEKLRQQALDLYDDAHRSFLERFERILRGANLPEEKISYLLAKYDENFPSPDKIRDVFGVILEGPIRIPSLVEEATRSAEMAEQLERESRADYYRMQQEIENSVLNAEREAQQRQESAVRELEQYWIKSIQESFAEGIERAKDDGFTFMAQILERMETIDPADMNNRTKGYFEARMRELQTCLDTLNSVQVNGEHPDPLLQRFAEVTRQLKVLSTSSVSKEKLQARINKLRDAMRDELGEVLSRSSVKGHRAIAKWMILAEEEPVNTPESPTVSNAAMILNESEPATGNNSGSQVSTRRSGIILEDAA